jgi:hypothetical protein
MNYNEEFDKDDYFILALQFVDNLEIYREERAGTSFSVIYMVNIV